jgi:hypothetical protein
VQTLKGSIMKATVLIQAAAVAAFAFTAFTAGAAPQDVKTLPRVVITGKAAPQVAQLPRVVITGHAVREVAQVQQLPRVTVVGVSEATLLRQQTLAAAKPTTRRA